MQMLIKIKSISILRPFCLLEQGLYSEYLRENIKKNCKTIFKKYLFMDDDVRASFSKAPTTLGS